MSVTLTSIAKEVGLKTADLKQKIVELGFNIEENKKTIEKELAELIKNELKKENQPEEEKSKAEIYEEIIEKELEKEIIKKQRKQTAGKKEQFKEEIGGNSEKEAETLKTGEKTIDIPDVISVKEFAEKSGISAAKIIGELMKNGILANINQLLDFETASIIASDLNVKIKRKRSASRIQDLLEKNLEKLKQEDDPSVLKERPPVVSVMGHVDHGKTKLLDTIRKTNVISSEAGHITQHIGAYQVEKNDKKITFLDTPGHEAFAEMRARGAQATDIAVLVVAADEGVKAQTLEALNHALDAKIPVIVAINKIDKENANPEKVKAELAEHGLQPEEWGGDTMMIPLSAQTGQGIDKLLESILFLAELKDFKANPERPAICTIIESNLDPSLGQVATVLVNTGTLKIMDNVVVGKIYGRIKTMIDSNGKRLKKLEPSGTAKISGFSGTPQVGDILQVVTNEKTARTQAIKISALLGQEDNKTRGIGVDEIMSKIITGEIKYLKIVLKADTKGSLEALKHELQKIKNEDVSIKIIHAGIGNISTSDVLMASASKGIVVGFQTEVGSAVRKVAERENVDILIYDVIYKLTDDLKKLLTGMLEPEIVEILLGKARVLKVFFTKKNEMIIGCKVIEGKIENKSLLRIFKNDVLLGEGQMMSLKKINDEVSEVKEGEECGMKCKSNIKFEEGLILEAYKKEKKNRTL
ncbi:translation initiation factor IF-2 [Candidatus Peregrinibacteria bacterium]|nr:translation initiation factor IF-2 [Candidatus Peregrinibacteria bacterium]